MAVATTVPTRGGAERSYQSRNLFSLTWRKIGNDAYVDGAGKLGNDVYVANYDHANNYAYDYAEHDDHSAENYAETRCKFNYVMIINYAENYA